jgi:thiol-disulfide isomerase/thioredoxin
MSGVEHQPGAWLRVIKLILSALLLCAVGVMPEAHAKTPGEVGIGEAVREATLQGLNGPSRKLSEFHGRPLIINVWASWCGPCREEMASMERLAWLEVARHFNVIGISTDDDPAQAGAWLKESKATISQFVDTRLQMENMLGASRLPLTVLVDADGRVVNKTYGAREWDSPESLQLIRNAFRTPRRAPLGDTERVLRGVVRGCELGDDRRHGSAKSGRSHRASRFQIPAIAVQARFFTL